MTAAVLFVSCRAGEQSILNKENLFSLSYGKADDSLFFSREKSASTSNTAVIKMVNGIFYIMNGNSKKIMKFTSYGDLITVIGSRDSITETILVEENMVDNKIVNRKAVFFPFNDIGNIEIDSRQYLYASDLLPQNRYEWDNNLDTMLTDVVYIFDNNFKYIDYLGQDGIGGIPFPFIQEIITNADNDLIIVSRTVESFLIYWFNSSWKLMYTVELNNDSIPYPVTNESLIASLDTIKVPDKSRSLFIKFDYYIINSSISTGDATDIDFYKSYVQVLDINTGRYVKSIELPDVFTVSSNPHNFAEERRQVVYNMLDVVGEETIYLSTIINNETQQLLILGTDGKVKSNTRLSIDYKSYLHVDINLSTEGIISALLAGDKDVSVVWWRSDRLLKEKT